MTTMNKETINHKVDFMFLVLEPSGFIEMSSTAFNIMYNEALIPPL